MSFWSDKITPFSGNKTLICGNNVLIIDKPLIMGILNLTPDSFFDGNRYNTLDLCISHTETMLTEGASIIDLGAVSTRPGAGFVSEDLEISRLLPVLETLALRYPETVFSVDTFRSKVAQLSFEAGAGLINDISGGSHDNDLLKTVAKSGLPYILMHMQGSPATMQVNPTYEDVTSEVKSYFEQKLQNLHTTGIKQVIIDPGFGFGKSIKHNYKLLRQLDVFKQFNSPLLVGLSRKSMIYKLLDITPGESLQATSALHLVSILNGADILRVHDVKVAVQMVKLASVLQDANNK